MTYDYEIYVVAELSGWNILTHFNPLCPFSISAQFTIADPRAEGVKGKVNQTSQIPQFPLIKRFSVSGYSTLISIFVYFTSKGVNKTRTFKTSLYRFIITYYLKR